MLKGKGRIIKRILAAVFVLLLVILIIYWDLVVYGFRQGKGQLTIIWNAKPVEQFLNDPNFPDSLKTKLHLISNVRTYAIDSLGLKDTENYKTMYDQKGQEIMWVVTACEPFQFKAKEWTFPVIGSVPYKGFFDQQLAIDLRDELAKEGWDVSIRNPGGWSTLGWFTDPILSNMLDRGDGDLANLIIHEMSHATIFVKDSVDFNENLATFIGDRGAEKFLIDKFGINSDEYRFYIDEDVDFLKFSDHMLRGSEKLDSLYKTMHENDPVEEKKRLKKEMIDRIINAMDTLSFKTSAVSPASKFKERPPNNAYFMNFKRYQEKQDTFWVEYRDEFKSDLKAYIKYLSGRYPFL